MPIKQQDQDNSKTSSSSAKQALFAAVLNRETNELEFVMESAATYHFCSHAVIVLRHSEDQASYLNAIGLKAKGYV